MSFFSTQPTAPQGEAESGIDAGPRTPTARRALAASTAAVGLALAVFAPAAAASTESEFGEPTPVRVERTEPAPVDVRPVSDRPVDVRPEERPENDVEVLRLECRPATQFDNAIGCAWSDVTANGAVGYQLWRIVDRGDREMAWRGGLDTTEQLDRVPGDAQVVRYAVLAVDDAGEIVARSRAERVVLPSDDAPNPVRPVRTAVRSVR